MYRTEFVGFSNNVLSVSKVLSVPTQYGEKKASFYSQKRALSVTVERWQNCFFEK